MSRQFCLLLHSMPHEERFYLPPLHRFPYAEAFPTIPDDSYSTTPRYPLPALKYAQQLAYSSGFDSTWRIQLTDQLIDPENVPTPFHDASREFEEEILAYFSILDTGFAEEIASGRFDEMSDAFYARMHVPLEIIERLHDHNKSRVEHTVYSIVDQIAEEVRIEDQHYKTFTPLQTYLKPFNVVLQQPHLACRFTNLDYQYQTFKDRVITCIYPNYRKEKLAPGDIKYCEKILEYSAGEFNQELVYQQKSAHDVWVRMIASACGIKIGATLSEAYNSIIEDYNLDFRKMLTSVCFKQPEASPSTPEGNLCIYTNYNLPKSASSRIRAAQYSQSSVTSVLPDSYKSRTESITQASNRSGDELSGQRDYYSDYSEDDSPTAFLNIQLEEQLEVKPVLSEMSRFLTLEERLVERILEEAQYIINLPQCTYNAEHELVFPSDFDVSVRGLIESKSSNNRFFTMNAVQKREFMALLVAERALTYQKIGLYSRMVYDWFVRGDQALYVKYLQKLTSHFLKSVQKQHNAILRAALLNNYVQQLISTETQLNGKSSAPKSLFLMRPVCGCYACNLAAIYDGEFFDYTSQIYGGCTISRGEMSGQDIMHNIMEVQAENFERYLPFFKTVLKDLAAKGVILSISQNNNEYAKKKIETEIVERPEIPDSELFKAVLAYAFLIPSFVNYRTTYGIPDIEFPVVIFDYNSVQNDIIKCFSANPHLFTFYQVENDEEISEVENPENINYAQDFRLQRLAYSCLVDRYHESIGGAPVDYKTQGILNWSLLQFYISMYGPASQEDIDWLEETPLDIHSQEQFKIAQGRIEEHLGPDNLERKVGEIWQKRLEQK